ncbi:C40 family peptidase [Deinococcus ruber]|uniref:Peptidase n=1 Tax=Deinococcus ruber TaxID=1848197 RepID=A0A918CEU6_9DEIO|nr:peptidoglycan endopeptidase [Deinococcus ruber]GGR20967.1 peptidase [Deinococcus ruber]
MRSLRSVSLLVALLLLTSGWSFAAPATLGSYVVQQGDTVTLLAQRWGVDSALIVRLNHLTSTDLRVGQQLLFQAPAGELPVSTHTVQAGQTLYSIARLYQSTAAELQILNQLSRPDLQVGQVLLLPSAAPQALMTAPATLPALVPPATLTIPDTVAPTQHQVLAGETLYGLARQYNLKVSDLMALNRLTSSTLTVGQLVQLPPPGGVPAGNNAKSDVSDSSSGPSSDAALPQDWQRLAMSLVGVPYQYGGSSRLGTDCSGLVLQIFAPLGLQLPRQSALQASVGQPVNLNDLQPGDLVFFDTIGRGTVTHEGVYLGGGAFINANSFDGRVAVNQMTEPYFSQRFLSARRILGVLGLRN